MRIDTYIQVQQLEGSAGMTGGILSFLTEYRRVARFSFPGDKGARCHGIMGLGWFPR